MNFYLFELLARRITTVSNVSLKRGHDAQNSIIFLAGGLTAVVVDHGGHRQESRPRSLVTVNQFLGNKKNIYILHPPFLLFYEKILHICKVDVKGIF